jgi:hypothetical protein
MPKIGLKVGVLACVFGLMGGACAADDEGEGGGDGVKSGAVDAANQGARDESEKCPEDYLAFATGEDGLHPPVADTNFEVRLLESDKPYPPRADFNTWTVAVRDATTGEPVTAATLTWACAWMGFHEHGTNPKQVEALGDGEFRLVKQNLAMFGAWNVRLWIDPSGQEPNYDPGGKSTLANSLACTPTTGLEGDPNVEFNICVPRSF